MDEKVLDIATETKEKIVIEEQRSVVDSSSSNEDVQAKTFSQKLSLVFASIALGSDGYLANVISAVNSCLEKIYGDSYDSTMSTRVSNAMLIGDIVGQVGFGLIIDRLGRKFGIVLYCHCHAGNVYLLCCIDHNKFT